MSSGQEVAKIVRKILKKEFPGIKFSVRSDYTSVRIYWTDGPTARDVEKFVNGFEYGHFDGMQDMYVHNKDRKQEGPDVKYVFTQREMSPQARQYIKDSISESYGIDIDSMSEREFFDQFRMWPESKVRGVFSAHDFTHPNPKLDWNRYSSVKKANSMKFKLEQNVKIGGTVISEGSIVEVIEEKDRVASVSKKAERDSYSNAVTFEFSWSVGGGIISSGDYSILDDIAMEEIAKEKVKNLHTKEGDFSVNMDSFSGRKTTFNCLWNEVE